MQCVTINIDLGKQEVAHHCGQLYHALGKEAFDANIRLWKFTPKLHLFMHLCLDQARLWGNPSYYWCYADEDLVGLMTTVAEKLHPAQMGLVLIVKWLILAFDTDDVDL